MNTHHVEQSDIKRMLPALLTRRGCRFASASQPMSGELLHQVSSFEQPERTKVEEKTNTDSVLKVSRLV